MIKKQWRLLLRQFLAVVVIGVVVVTDFDTVVIVEHTKPERRERRKNT